MKFYISDMHLGHANIIRHSNRPFNNVDEMDKTIISNWRERVSKDDDIYCVGDMMFKVQNPKTYLEQLTGRIHLIKGNHDHFIKDRSLWKYFESIDDYLKINDNGRTVILFHYPLAEWDGFYRDSIHLFGHIHNNDNDAAKIMRSIKNCYNVGADLLGFTPRTLDEIIKINKK